jgi:multidrug efflux pump subunit AcrA (membrane-fusion protein)
MSRGDGGSRFVLWASVLSLGVAVGWAAVSEIDQVTRATGKVIASSRSQVVQAVEGGVLETLNVREGDAVQQGQLLAVLDKTRLNAQFQESRAKAVALLINSPGGSPVQSHLIYRRVRQLADEKKIPVIVFLEDADFTEAVVILHREAKWLRRRKWTCLLLHNTFLPGSRRSTAPGGFHGFGG